MDHTQCSRVADGDVDLMAHTHEGEQGFWLFPGEEKGGEWQ